MGSLLKRHGPVLLGLALAINLGLLLHLGAGEPKAWAEITWTDVAGEGGSALLALVWLGMLLHSRPGGRVTRLLALGLACVCFAWSMDLLDEFIRLPDSSRWDNWLETAPMPVGLLLLTAGLYHLTREQQAINAQMSKRERLFREHRLFDHLTPLGDAEYLRQQITLALCETRREQRPLSLLVIDLDDFSQVNQRYGHAEGDRVLQAVAQLLLLNLRHQDLLCRLAGDRFVALLPDTGESLARQLAAELEDAVHSLAHRSHPHGERITLRASSAVAMALDEDAEQLLARLNRQLAMAKQRLPRCA